MVQSCLPVLGQEVLQGNAKFDRNKFLGASEIPAVLGLSPFKSALDVFLEKTGRLAQSPPSIQMRAGNYLEPLVLSLFTERTGISLKGAQAHLTHRAHPFISATVDSLTDDDSAVVEAKTTGSAKGWGEEETDQVPEHILVQCVQQMAVAYIPLVWIPVLIERNDFRIYRIERDVELEKMVIDRGVKFWSENVMADVAPEPRTLEDLKLLFPKSRESAIPANEEIILSLGQLSKIARQIDDLEREEKNLKFHVQSFMGENDTLLSGVGGKRIATWKTQETVRVDVKALKEAYPQIAEIVSKTTLSRVFRLSSKKE